MFLLPRLFFLRISSVLNTAYSTSSHVGALGEVKSRTPSPYILPQFSKNSAFPSRTAFAGSSGHHCPSHTEKEKKVSENTSMAALYLGSLTPLQPFKVDEGVSLTGQPAKSSRTRHRNPNRSGRSACGRAMASLAACPASHGCSKKPTQPLLLPKRNKMKVLFNKTGSPKQSLSVAQLTATSEHRLVLCSARAAWGLLVRAAGQVSGAAWRCGRLPRGRRWPGTAGGGDSRRAAGRHVTGLGGSEQPGQTKLPEPCGAADVRAPSPGAPGYRPAPCLCPEDGPGPCVGPPLAQHPQNIGEMF